MVYILRLFIYKKIKDAIPKKLKHILQIICSLLKDGLVACQSCESLEFERHSQTPDYNWLAQKVSGYQKRAQPGKLSAYYLNKKQSIVLLMTKLCQQIITV